MSEPTPDQMTYDLLYRETVERPDGTLNPDTTIPLLLALGKVFQKFSLLLDYLTEGAINNPNLPLDQLTKILDEYLENTVGDEIAEFAKVLLHEIDENDMSIDEVRDFLEYNADDEST